MKFLVPNYSCLQNPWLGGYRPQIPVLSVLNWICWTPTEKKSWVHHWFQVALLMSLILFHCPGRFHSVWLFWRHNLGFLTVSFLQWQVVGLLPSPQPAGPVHFIYNPLGRVAQLYPQALGTHFSRLLQPAWAAVGLFCSLVTTQTHLPN